MPVAKPCLGYPSRTAAVVALTKDGLTPEQISDRSGLSISNVKALLSAADKSTGRRALWVSADAIQSLEAPATRRGLTAMQLAERMIEAAAESNLIDAILDDGLA